MCAVSAGLEQGAAAAGSGGCLVFIGAAPTDRASPVPAGLQFGARCCTVQGEEVTHVVAGAETDKTRWAARAGKHVVSASWLWCSGEPSAAAPP
jgi:hypothetical protein